MLYRLYSVHPVYNISRDWLVCYGTKWSLSLHVVQIQKVMLELVVLLPPNVQASLFLDRTI